jgi:hypothetical protein
LKRLSLRSAEPRKNHPFVGFVWFVDES